MPATGSWKKNQLLIAFCIYAVLSLVSMATMSIGAAILGVAILIEYGGFGSLFGSLKKEWRNEWLGRYGYLSVGLVLACGISLIGAELFPLSYGGKQSHISFFKIMAKSWYFLWPIILLLGFRKLSAKNSKNVPVVLKTWAVTFFVLSVVGIIQHFTGWPRPQSLPYFDDRFHATLFLGHHLSVASVWIFPFFALLDLGWKKNGAQWLRLPRWFILLAVLAGGITLFLTYSRMVWVSVPIGIVVWFVLSLPKKKLAPALAVLFLVGIGVTQVPAVKNRLFQTWGVSDRFDLWEAHWDFFKKRPLIGAGWRTTQELSGYYLLNKYPQKKSVFSGHAHNNFIEMFGGTGLIGIGSWFAWCVGIFLLLWPTRKLAYEMTFPIGMTCAWLAFHLNGLTQVNFWEAKVMHQMMWAVALAMFWQQNNAGAGKSKR